MTLSAKLTGTSKDEAGRWFDCEVLVEVDTDVDTVVIGSFDAPEGYKLDADELMEALARMCGLGYRETVKEKE